MAVVYCRWLRKRACGGGGCEGRAAAPTENCCSISKAIQYRRLLLAAGFTGHGTVGLYCLRRVDLPDMGRNIQSISLNLHRQLWHEIRDGKSQSAVQAKGTSAFLVPVSNMIKTSTGTWHTVFVLTALMNFVVVGLALLVLKPMRSRLV